MEDIKEKAWTSWREDLIEVVGDLVRRFPAIVQRQEFEDLKAMLEHGPILIDLEKFRKALQ
jgi:hypothetical protein